MRTALCAFGLVLALGGQQKPSDLYASAITKYVGGDFDAAAQALGSLTRDQVSVEVVGATRALLTEKKRGADLNPAALRRLEAAAVLHTEYALFADIDEKAVSFHMDMAHLLLTLDRELAESTDVASTQERSRARELIPHWSALAAGVLLTHSLDQNAATVIEEALKLLPDNSKLLFWRGVVMEFQAVWVGTPAANVRVAVPAMNSADGAGYDMLTNTRTWTPVDEAYRRALQRDDNPEIHLHLGYVRYSLRNYGAAKSEYEVARDKSTDTFVVYLADLLLARLKEDENDPAGAVQDYERAIATLPGAQSAYVGLGLLDARRGNAQQARELTMRLAAIPETQRVRDPWWAYRTTRVPADDLHWLRQAVQR